MVDLAGSVIEYHVLCTDTRVGCKSSGLASFVYHLLRERACMEEICVSFSGAGIVLIYVAVYAFLMHCCVALHSLFYRCALMKYSRSL